MMVGVYFSFCGVPGTDYPDSVTILSIPYHEKMTTMREANI